MEDSNGTKAEVRLERLEDASSEKGERHQFSLGIAVAVGTSVLGSATAIVLTLVKYLASGRRTPALPDQGPPQPPFMAVASRHFIDL